MAGGRRSQALMMPALRWIGRFSLWIAVTLLAQSAFWPGFIPLALKVAVAALAVITAWRPWIGLVLLAGLVPFGNTLVTRVWSASTFGLTEALALAFLSGYLVPWRRSTGRSRADTVTYAGLTLATVIVASCAVQFAVERAWQDHWPPFIVGTLHYLAFDYLTLGPDIRPWVVGLGFLPPALLWLEGLGVFFIARSLCRAMPSLWRSLVAVAVVASTGAALLTWARFMDVMGQTGASLLTMMKSGDRFTAAIPSINPSASYFAMMSLVALGLAWQARGAWRVLWFATAAIITPAAIVTKSRAGIVAWVAMAGTMLARRIIRGRRSAVLVAGLLVVIGIPVAIQSVNLFDVVRPDSSDAIRVRRMLAQGAVRMIEANPFFGVGVRMFRLRFPEYRPPAAEEIRYNEDDPHNHVLGIATELGVVGLAAFLWFLGTGLWRAVQVLRARPLDGAAVGLFAGVAAILLTGLSHQPLHVPIVAFSFWILFSACQVQGAGLVDESPGLTARGPGPWRRSVPFATAAAIAAILISIPFRARAEIEQIDMTKVQYGFHDWDRDGHGTKFRWSSDHSTMFLPSDMSLINLPIGASLGGTPNGVNVRVFVDGEPAGQLFLTDEAWHDVRLVAPRSGRKSWRIDLYVSPTFVPMQIDPAILDARTLGVRVGEPVRRELLR